MQVLLAEGEDVEIVETVEAADVLKAILVEVEAAQRWACGHVESL